MAVFREFIAATTLERIPLLNKLDELLKGKLNTVEEITLTENQATTTITDELVSPNSHVSLSPTTANAATALATTYISTYGDGSYTITHTNNAQTDRTFRVTVTG